MKLKKKININYKQSKTLDIFKCFICNESANKYKHGNYCILHSKLKVKCKGICKNGNKCNKNATIQSFCKIHFVP